MPSQSEEDLPGLAEQKKSITDRHLTPRVSGGNEQQQAPTAFACPLSAPSAGPGLLAIDGCIMVKCMRTFFYHRQLTLR